MCADGETYSSVVKNKKTKNGGNTMGKLMNFFKDEEGATAVEYGVLLAVILAVCIASYVSIGGKVSAKLIDINTALT